ncbi:sugar transporter STL1 [Myriangium duriaei CBS 260.36]|uniref:Sugar transporter STL1 n=1 Tax=Myriangium duriaei CBS 260.36 TaxID=1168546 RepID=A0A9P4J989_9PEZI|nr:sugar transporter STL1 [Myriangium duriaei CBS 260.36]
MFGKKFYGLRGFPLALAIGVIAGMDFLLFGFDQGVMGGILTMDTFFTRFPSIDVNNPPSGQSSSHVSTTQGITVASYNLGCFAGAVATIWLGDNLGRKRMIFFGSAIMVIGAALQASAFSIPHLVVGRLITGFGNGMNTSTVPTWQSETSKSHRRGQLVMVEGALITGGIMLSYWIDYAFAFTQPSEICWRFPLAFQIVFALIILACIPGLPESPRWLVLKNRDQEAREVLSALWDKDLDDPSIESEFTDIKEAVAVMASGSFKDLFTMDQDRNFHRSVLAYVVQAMQQLSGINLITYYAATIYTGSLGLNQELSRLLAALNGTEYFLASWIPVFTVEKFGRRPLMLFGAVGMSISMAVLTGTTVDPNNKSAGIAAAVFLFVFNSFFAIGWLGMTWLYPAEIVPLRIRAPANALSTSANWITNFLVVMITPIAFDNIKYRTYIIFAVINAAIVPCVYFFYPETAGRSLEEMDAIFHKTTGPFDVVQHAKEMPRRYDNAGKLIVNPAEENGKADVQITQGDHQAAAENGLLGPGTGSLRGSSGDVSEKTA